MLKFLAILFVMTSCGAAYHLKRAEKHLKKAEQLGAKVTADTIYQDREVITEKIEIDTVIKATHGDTVVIHKEKLRIKYVQLPGEKVYIQGECDSDTIRIKVPVTVYREIKAKGGIPWWWLLVAAVVGGVILKIVFIK